MYVFVVAVLLRGCALKWGRGKGLVALGSCLQKPQNDLRIARRSTEGLSQHVCVHTRPPTEVGDTCHEMASELGEEMV